MREISVELVKKTVEELCVKANLYLPDGMKEKINSCIGCEKSPLSKQVLGDIVRNIDCAKELEVPICQDTGMAVIFLEVGQDVHFTGGNLTEAINEGVANGYVNGKLRLSVVEDPLERKNTNNNTPAIVHTSIVPGDKVHIMVAPKGFGSENMSALKMFTPSATREDIVNFVVETVSKAGSNPCPPITVGVGIGGDFELSAILAKGSLQGSESQKSETALRRYGERDARKDKQARNRPSGLRRYSDGAVCKHRTAPDAYCRASRCGQYRLSRYTSRRG